LRWLSLPRGADLPASVCEELGVEPLPGWDWMSATTVADVPGTNRVERLDLSVDLPAIVDCLAAGNPTTDSDPAGPHEAGWWGVRDGDRLTGVIGAGSRGGTSAGGVSWHLHGLGVRPEGRRSGLGTALMVAATAEGLAAGADWVSLGVWADNEPALRIYRRLGFRTDHQGRSYRPTERPTRPSARPGEPVSG
jgi:ribosomal protein S18 acetylase RimI-like enzyme